MDTRCSLEDLTGTMVNWDKWQEKVRVLLAISTTWWYKLVKLATIVEDDPKAPFPLATRLRCSGGHSSFPWIAPLLPLIHTLYYWMFSKKASSTIFWVFDMTQSGIEPQSTRPLANTLPTGLMYPKNIKKYSAK